MTIRLHKEHGLNPTLSQCIICGNDTGEIALLGAGYKGEAPMHLITSVEPCTTCRDTHLSKGVLLVEANVDWKSDDKKSYQPTGKLVVLKDEAFVRCFDKSIPKEKICFVEVGLIDKITSN